MFEFEGVALLGDNEYLGSGLILALSGTFLCVPPLYSDSTSILFLVTHDASRLPSCLVVQSFVNLGT